MAQKKRKMHPAQLPIYRALERLLLWVIPMVAKLPKNVAFATLGEAAIHDVCDCLEAVTAFQSLSKDDPNIRAAKKRCLLLVTARMTALKTKTRVLVQQRIRVIGKDNNDHLVPILSPRQEAVFLDLLNPIEFQAYAWLGREDEAAYKPGIYDQGYECH